MQNSNLSLDEAWDWVRNQTSQPAPQGSVPFCIHDAACGVLTPHSLSVLQDLPADVRSLFQHDKNTVRLVADNVDQALETTARELLARNALPEWRNEKLDIVADANPHRVLGAAERGIFRFFGLLTQCVHAVGCDQAGKFYCGLRAPTKSIDPNLLDTLSGGLVASQESWSTALARETGEEAGLDPDNYECDAWTVWTAQRPVDKGYMRELTISCRITLQAEVQPHNRDGEVAAFVHLSAEDLIQQILAGRVTLEAALSFMSFLSPKAAKESQLSREQKA